MPSVVFEPTIPAFERVKTVHALDRAATVIGRDSIHNAYQKPWHMLQAGEWWAKQICGNSSLSGLGLCVYVCVPALRVASSRYDTRQ
jgi:hypothetical protein